MPEHQDILLIGKLSFATELTAEQINELRKVLHDFGEMCMGYHNSHSGECPLCDGWGAPTGCRCCGTKCMGG